MRRKKGRRHLLSKKSSKKKRFLEAPAVVSKAHAPLYKRLIKGV